MDLEQILVIFIILLSFIGPAIRKLFEKKQPAQQNRSREEVRKYLEKMRELQQVNTYEEEEEEEEEEEKYVPLAEKIEKKNPQSLYYEKLNENKFDRINRLVEQDVNQHVEKHINNNLNIHVQNHINNDVDAYVQEHLGTSQTFSSSKKNNSKLQELVLDNKNFDDLQRAFVLGEIFNKPKSLSEYE